MEQASLSLLTACNFELQQFSNEDWTDYVKLVQFIAQSDNATFLVRTARWLISGRHGALTQTSWACCCS